MDKKTIPVTLNITAIKKHVSPIFIECTQEEYDSLEDKDDDNLYFATQGEIDNDAK